MRCATGEQYVTYALAGQRIDALAQCLMNTFRVLSQHTALHKREGAPVCIADERPRYLYWRWYPEITGYERLPESINDQEWKRKPKLWQVYARAVVSLERCDKSQHAMDEHSTRMRVFRG